MVENNSSANKADLFLMEKSFEKVLSPFQAFIKDQTTSSLILIICTFLALIIANSPFYQDYEKLLHIPVGFIFNDLMMSMSLRHWINDGLMTFFFFLLGMEIKRELLVGEINNTKLLIPIVAAAIGGMLVPAAIFYGLNMGTEFSSGWGIPMATDTAFAVGILALLGARVPVAAVTFLTALAIIDDLGAILVIAVFYSQSINLNYLLLAFAALAFLMFCNLLGVRRSSVYLFGGVTVWGFMLDSGLHATVAGVLVAVTVPARPKQGPKWFIQRVDKLIRKFRFLEDKKQDQQSILAEAEQHAVVENIQQAAEKSTTPLRRWEHVLEHPVSLFVLPIFALANAGVPLNFELILDLWNESLALGIIFGLLLGKGIGIPLFVWLTIRMKLGQLPAGLHMQHIIGLGLLGGMGFTMSIFISNLGFDSMLQASSLAKTSILLASLMAGVSGYLWLRHRT